MRATDREAEGTGHHGVSGAELVDLDHTVSKKYEYYTLYTLEML
jgi:hypothetical protein